MPVPFLNEEFTFTNPDGSTIRVRGSGNQHYAVFETIDGYTIVKDPDSGFYQYAELSADKNDLKPTGTNVDVVDPTTLGLSPHIRVRRDAAKQKAMSASMLKEDRPQWQIRREERKLKRRYGMPTMAAPDGAPQSGTTLGNYVGLCLLIEFPDVSSTISRKKVDDFCNKSGYSEFGNNGSVKEYFYDNSRGKLTYTNVVTQYYKAAHNRSYYTDPGVSFGSRARALIKEALDSLKSKGFDFNQLSSDSSGYIYALNVFYVGARVNNWSEGLWPHSWVLASPYDAGGGKKFRDYQITNMGSQLSLRTFCHENGHMICDYPDLYDYGGESSGIGNYCLMCHGGNDKNPVQVCAYLKNESGWATKLTTITPGSTASLNSTGNEFYIHAKNSDEYFIIENRQKTGRDTFLPDSGLAIWHVDESASNNNEQMTAAQHYECSLEQADNRFDMEHRTNAGDVEDLFASPGNGSFSDTSQPDSKWWDGSNSGLNISQVSVSGVTMTFVASATAGWASNKKVLYTYAHANTKNVYAIIESLSGWRLIAPKSPDGVTNVLTILDSAKVNDKQVNVYIGADNQIHAVYMV